jgi:hypothetical protein
MPNARSPMRASPWMSCVRLKIAAWPLQRTHHLKPPDCRIHGLQRFETSHWANQLLQLTVISLDDIVQILDLSMHRVLSAFASGLKL